MTPIKSIHQASKASINPRFYGFTLVEVLITNIVMSVGLLGIAGLQLTSLKNNDSAYLYSISALYSYSLIDYMRANRKSAIAGNYNIGLSRFTDLAPISVSSSLAEVDRYHWYLQLNNDLPNAKAAINCNANIICAVKIEWDDSVAAGTALTKNTTLTAQL